MIPATLWTLPLLVLFLNNPQLTYEEETTEIPTTERVTEKATDGTVEPQERLDSSAVNGANGPGLAAAKLADLASGVGISLGGAMGGGGGMGGGGAMGGALGGGGAWQSNSKESGSFAKFDTKKQEQGVFKTHVTPALPFTIPAEEPPLPIPTLPPLIISNEIEVDFPRRPPQTPWLDRNRENFGSNNRIRFPPSVYPQPPPSTTGWSFLFCDCMSALITDPSPSSGVQTFLRWLGSKASRIPIIGGIVCPILKWPVRIALTGYKFAECMFTCYAWRLFKIHLKIAALIPYTDPKMFYSAIIRDMIQLIRFAKDKCNFFASGSDGRYLDRIPMDFGGMTQPQGPDFGSFEGGGDFKDYGDFDGPQTGHFTDNAMERPPYIGGGQSMGGGLEQGMGGNMGHGMGGNIDYNMGGGLDHGFGNGGGMEYGGLGHGMDYHMMPDLGGNMGQNMGGGIGQNLGGGIGQNLGGGIGPNLGGGIGQNLGGGIGPNLGGGIGQNLGGGIGQNLGGGIGQNLGGNMGHDLGGGMFHGNGMGGRFPNGFGDGMGGITGGNLGSNVGSGGISHEFEGSLPNGMTQKLGDMTQHIPGNFLHGLGLGGLIQSIGPDQIQVIADDQKGRYPKGDHFVTWVDGTGPYKATITQLDHK